MLKLYHGRTSVCSVKARLALVEKGLSFESQLLMLQGDQYEPAYMKLNPMRWCRRWCTTTRWSSNPR
jgi:glutathione S-transferase